MRRFMMTESKIATASPLSRVATTSEKSGCSISKAQQQPGSSQNSEFFEQRKAMKAAYVELFKALFKIPDKQMQQRVMDAINGVTVKERPCDECRKRVVVKLETSNMATQTEIEHSMQNNYSFNNLKACHRTTVSITESDSNSAKSQPGELSHLVTNPITLGANHEELEECRQISLVPIGFVGTGLSRKRKRKNCVPRVIKQSQAQMHQEEIPLLNHKGSTKRNEVTKPIVDLDPSPNAVASFIANDNFQPAKRQRCDSSDFTSPDFCVDFSLWEFSDLFQHFDLAPKQFKEHFVLHKVLTVMEKEYHESEKSDADDSLGYLPIHDALYENNLDRLRRQIYVWKKLKKTPLNNVLTEYGKDCMEVALGHNSNTKAIEILINDGFNINCFYEDVGNVLHLAICNEVDLETFKLLARKVEFDMLRNRNDDGYTPLFLALRHNKYLYLEVLLQVIDERLNLTSHNRAASLSDSEKDNLEELTQFYALQCKNIDGNKSPDYQIVSFRAKQRILNEPDSKSGNTMLLFAIEHHLEHFIYMLLANFADPSVQNYNGQDVRSFYNEYVTEKYETFFFKMDDEHLM